LQETRNLTEEYAQKRLDTKSIDELAEAIFRLRRRILGNCPDIQPYFKLHPPNQGVQRQNKEALWLPEANLGYRGDKINELIKRMI
jgi:hypothetical protein